MLLEHMIISESPINGNFSPLSIIFFRKSLEDYPFVKEPPEELFCPVTFKLLLQPHLTSCCGQHVSQDAVKRIKKEGKGCPLCNSKEWFTMMNKHFLRQVTHLPVLCRDTECGWKGILSELENHMQSYHPSCRKYIIIMLA